MNLLTERHILPFGNYAMATAGPLYATVANPRPGRRLPMNGSIGQPVAFVVPNNGTQPTIIGAADVPTTKEDVHFGIFVDPYGDGYATSVQLVAGEKIESCLLDSLSVSKPDCGNPMIQAITLDCVECAKSYTAQVSIRDMDTASYNDVTDVPEKHFFTHHTQCNSCDDCDPQANCKDIVNGLVDQINGSSAPTIDGRLYPDYKAPEIDRSRVRAVVGHSTWKTYCITPDAAASECQDCNTIDKIETATINGTSYTFVRNEDPTDEDKTLLAQLEDIAYQIEDTFTSRIGKHSGFAVVVRGATDCCPIQLHVVTCDENFAIAGLTECDLDPDMTFPGSNLFADCVTPVPGTYTPPCWFAIIAAPKRVNCETCDLTGPMQWYGVDVDIEILKDASSYSPIIKKKTLLESRSPSGFGAQIRYLQYHYGEPGGRGRDWNYSNPQAGILGMPDSTSRFKNAITAKCGSQYCSVTMKYHKNYKYDLEPSLVHTEFTSVIHLDTKDTTTVASVLAFINALGTKSGGACKYITTASCS